METRFYGKKRTGENHFCQSFAEQIRVQREYFRLSRIRICYVCSQGRVADGKGVEKAIDCSANDSARQLAIRATKPYGKIAFVGEGGTCSFNPSPDIIHGQKTIYGSWVTSLWKMEELVDKFVRCNIHPDKLITHKFALKDAANAYALMASGKCGKVAVVFED